MSINSLTKPKSPQRIMKSPSINSKTHAVHPLSETSSPSKSPSQRNSNIEPIRFIQSYKEEMVAAFFTTMLVHVIDRKEVCEELVVDSCPNLPNINVTSKNFKDLVDNDFTHQDVVSVDGSQVSLGSQTKKLRPKRSGSMTSKRSSQTQGSIKSPNESLGRKRKHTKSASSILPKITEADSGYNRTDLYQDTRVNSWTVKDCREYVTLTFNNGNIYQGPLQNYLFHGEGSFFWNDGTIYFGHFEKGEINGCGKMIYSDMSVYNGYFFNGKPHGMGAFYMAYTRTLYSGHWVHGKKKGKGWLYYSENNWYDGEWLNDCRDGFGTRLYTNGTKYTGIWKDGVRQGQGACAFNNGDFYNGKWRNGEMHGYGEYTWCGFFNKSLSFPVENIYLGQWTYGKRNGFGHLYFGLEHGARLVGFWDMDFKHGLGIVINSNGDITERDPLFYNDKPAHITISDKNNSSHIQSFNQHRQQQFLSKSHKYGGNSPNITPKSSQGWLPRSTAHKVGSLTQASLISDFNAHTSMIELIKTTNFEKRPSIFNRAKGNFGTERMSCVQNIDRLQDFPQERILCNPIILHTRTAPETLNLFFYINKYIEEAREQMRISDISNTFFQNNATDQQMPSDDNFWNETNNLRNVIWHYTNVLQTVYEMYANISNHPCSPNRKYTLIRLYLWQLYRDIQIYKHGLSLFETDEILLEYPGHCLETNHHPFERIYYWQFLWSLIGVAWKIDLNKKNKVELYTLRPLNIVFEEFLTSTLLPNAGHHQGQCLFEFKNLLPIKDVFALYEDVGPFLTAREFLNKCCCKKRMEPPCHMQYFGDNSVIQSKYGVNTIAVGRNFVYLSDEEDCILNNNPPDIYPLEIDKFFKTLKVFRHIGPQRVINSLTLACPLIKTDAIIVNMDVKLTFLEFYETLIYCAYKSILLANLKERCKNFVLDDRRSRSEKFDKPMRGRRDSRKRKK